MRKVVSWKRVSRQGMAVATGGALTPADIASLYGMNALHQRGLYGQGQAIAFIEFATPSAHDDAQFWSAYSVAPQLNTPVATVPVDRAPSDPAAADETDLDVQYAGALAPGAQLTAYIISDQTDVAGFLGQMYDALQQAAADGARIVSVSLGTGELAFAAATGIRAPRAGRSWSDAAAYGADLDALIRNHGLLVFVAAGDSGAYSGLPYGDHNPQPSWPATQPAVVAVGGTQLATPGTLGSGEQAWGGQCIDPLSPGYDAANTLPQASGGGGVSTVFAAPSRQAGLGLGRRATPDIAAFSGPLVITEGGRSVTIWGTSASAPIAAAAAALRAQTAGAVPSADRLCADARDVATGNNWNDALLLNGLTAYFSAGPGYDLCTGMGRLAL